VTRTYTPLSLGGGSLNWTLRFARKRHRHSNSKVNKHWPGEHVTVYAPTTTYTTTTNTITTSTTTANTLTRQRFNTILCRWVGGIRGRCPAWRTLSSRVQSSPLQNAGGLVYDIILVCYSHRLYVLYYFVHGNFAAYRAFCLHLKTIISGCCLLSLCRYFAGWSFTARSWFFLPKTVKSTPLIRPRIRKIGISNLNQVILYVYQYYELCLLLYNRTRISLESRTFNKNKMLNKYMIIFLEFMFFMYLLIQYYCK